MVALARECPRVPTQRGCYERLFAKTLRCEAGPVRAAERSAGRRGGQLGEHGGLPLERLPVALEGVAVGQLAGVEVAGMRPVVVLPASASSCRCEC